MKRLLGSCFVLLFAIGCTSQKPIPSGASRVNIHVVAKPKDGVKQAMPRVAVYDAAPKTAKATGEYERVDYSNLDDVIVWLQPNLKSNPHAAMQSGSVDADKPSSVVGVMSVNGTVVLHNASQRTVSLYSVSEGNEFESGQLPPGGETSFAAKTEGLIEILSDPSKPPVALFYAAPGGWVARAKSGEIVTFDVPPGAYDVGSWHPRLPSGRAKLDAVAGQAVDCTIRVGVGAMSDSSSSK